MDNNLYNVEKNLRSIAKRCKTVKYSLGLVILFLMLGGGGALSEEINNEKSQLVNFKQRLDKQNLKTKEA